MKLADLPFLPQHSGIAVFPMLGIRALSRREGDPRVRRGKNRALANAAALLQNLQGRGFQDVASLPCC